MVGQKSNRTWRTVMRAAGDFVDFNHGDRTKLYMRKVQNASVPRKYICTSKPSEINTMPTYLNSQDPTICLS